MEEMKGIMGGEVKEYGISVLCAYHQLCISSALLLKSLRLSLAHSSPSASSLSVSSFLGLLKRSRRSESSCSSSASSF